MSEQEQNKSLVPINYQELGLTEADKIEYELLMVEAEQEVLYGANLRKMLPIIKMPAAGGSQFEISDMEQGLKTIEIVVPVVHRVRAYYHPKSHPDYDAENKAPICASLDLIHGNRAAVICNTDPFYQGQSFIHDDDKIFGRCSACALNRFKTAIGDTGEISGGKGCKDKIRLYCFSVKKFLTGNDIPYLLSLPVTSIGNWETYIGQLRNINTNPSQIVTKVTLKVIERGAVKYAVAEFSIFQDLRVDNPALCVKFGLWRKNHADQLKMLDAGIEEQVLDNSGVPF
jgi:hypothetical protein